jgi:hypothetical protein
MNDALNLLGHTSVHCCDGKCCGIYNHVPYSTSADNVADVHAAAFRTWAEAHGLLEDVLPVQALTALGFTITLTDKGLTVRSPHGATSGLLGLDWTRREDLINYACKLERAAAMKMVPEHIGLCIILTHEAMERRVKGVDVMFSYYNHQRSMTYEEFLNRMLAPHYMDTSSNRTYVTPPQLLHELFVCLKVDRDTRRVRRNQREDVLLFADSLVAAYPGYMYDRCRYESAIKTIFLNFVNALYPAGEFPLLMIDLWSEFVTELAAKGEYK